MTISLTLDGHPIQVAEGTTIWEAAQSQGIAIPTLCHDPRLRPVGVCRLCVVDVGGRVLAASCVRPCEAGMQVVTHNEKIQRHRRMLTALLLEGHPSPCAQERTTGDCQLEQLGRTYGLQIAGRTSPIDASDLSSPVIAVDHGACILCDRCLRGCNEVQSNHVLGRSGKGHTTRIAFDLTQPMGDSTCVSCGECAAVCPTGALTNKPLSLPLVPREQSQAVDSVCPYCGVGCALTYHVKENRILWAEGRDSPVNHSRLCVKGRYGWDYTHHADRLTQPLVRRPEFSNKSIPLPEDVHDAFRPATWDEALNLVSKRLMEIRKISGPRALAGFGSAKCSNEEAYLFQKLMRAALGTNNVDHCTRLCHASSVAALLEGIGSGAVTDVFGDARHADLLLLTGTNTTVNHPVAATFFKEAIARGTRLIVVDPRRPAIADFATWYCRLNPGTDVAFYNALMHVLIRENLINNTFIRDRTEGYEALRSLVADYAPERVSGLCGIAAPTIEELARAIGAARAMMIFWGMGISQHSHGTDNARCLIALALLTGNIGRIGTGLHPLRGQNNVQGASDAGLIPMVYPDYQPVGAPDVRARFEAAWGTSLDPNPGLTVVEIMAAALEGRIQGMYMLGENPFLSDPNITKVRKALATLEFLAVQDIFLTETAEYADVILPAASFFEKTGTYTNTDRRVQIGQQILEPPGSAKADWRILCELSTRLGFPMNYPNPEAIFAEFTELTTSYRGLTYERLGPWGRLWPCPDLEQEGTAVLFGDRFPTPSGRGRLVPCAFAPAKELPDEEYPLVLNTGRVLEHWHTGTMTRRAAALDALEPDPFVEVHPSDMERYALVDGQYVTVRSRRGAITLKVRRRDEVSVGSVFIPFHFREAAANVLTNDVLDPYGKIPEYKFCAVRLEG